MKRVYRDKKAVVHWSATRIEERVSSCGYVNRTLCFSTGLHRIPRVRNSDDTFEIDAFDA